MKPPSIGWADGIATLGGNPQFSADEWRKVSAYIRELQKWPKPDTVTIPRAEHERLKDAERIVWCLRDLHLKGRYPRITKWVGGEHHCTWMLETAWNEDGICLGHAVVPVLTTDSARAIIDAAMKDSAHADRT